MLCIEYFIYQTYSTNVKPQLKMLNFFAILQNFITAKMLLVSNNSQFLGIPNVIQLLYKQSHNINIIRISM